MKYIALGFMIGMAIALYATAALMRRDLHAIAVQLTEANCIALAENGVSCPAIERKP